MMAKGYKDLLVWQKAIDMVDVMYEIVRSFPSDERFRLVDQILRAAISIPANISEGGGRSSTKEYIQFINIAKGSLAELETHLIIARRREYITVTTYQMAEEMLDDIDKMLFRLKQSLQRKLAPTEHRTLSTEHV